MCSWEAPLVAKRGTRPPRSAVGPPLGRGELAERLLEADVLPSDLEQREVALHGRLEQRPAGILAAVAQGEAQRVAALAVRRVDAGDARDALQRLAHHRRV